MSPVVIGLPSSPRLPRVEEGTPTVTTQRSLASVAPIRRIEDQRHDTCRSVTSEFTSQPAVDHRPLRTLPSKVARYDSHSGDSNHHHLPQRIKHGRRVHFHEGPASQLTLSQTTTLTEPPPFRDKTHLTITPDRDHKKFQQLTVGKDSSSAVTFFSTTNHYWNRVNKVTRALAQWKANFTPLDPEVEDDDHLLKVMRAYHINKAQTLDDLPDWLFSEKEKGMNTLLHSGHPRVPTVAPPAESRHGQDQSEGVI